MVVERGGGLNAHFLSRCRSSAELYYMGQWTHEIAKLIVIMPKMDRALFFIAADKLYSPAPDGFA